MIQADTLPAVTEIATTIGGEVSSLVVIVLGLVIKVVVDFTKKISTHFDAATPATKLMAVVGFGQLTAYISAKTGIFIDPDITMLDTSVVGAMLSAVSMGTHGLIKTVKTTVEEKVAE